jgi:hypothetical protein
MVSLVEPKQIVNRPTNIGLFAIERGKIVGWFYRVPFPFVGEYYVGVFRGEPCSLPDYQSLVAHCNAEN